MSKSTKVNEYGFTPFAKGRCQVYYSQREYISTFVESICIHKFNECIPENVLIIWVLTNYLLVNAQWTYIQLRVQYVYFVSTKTIKQNYQTLYFKLAPNKVSFVFENKYYNCNFAWEGQIK